MTTANSILANINQIHTILLKAGEVKAQNSAFLKVVDETEIITFENDAKHRFESSLEGYLRLFRDKQYSILMSDGGILQFTYAVRNGVVVFHRLLFFPCPVSLTNDELEQMSIPEAIESMSPETTVERIRLEAPLRFDFSPEDAADEHAASHLHLSDDSRIPVCGPLSPASFARFIMRYFYPEIFASTSKLRALQSPWLTPAISTSQEKDLHLSATTGWRRPTPK